MQILPINTFKMTDSIEFKAHDLLHRDDIDKLRPTENLFLLAHPDDESCFFYHLANLVNKDSDSVQLVYTNSGQKGRDARGILERYDPQMKDLREKELSYATDEDYGLNRAPLIMDFIDGETHQDKIRDEIKIVTEAVLEKIQPKNIYTFEPNGITYHSDHRTISEVATEVYENNRDNLTRDTNLWHVGLMEKSRNLLIEETQKDTHIFTYAKAALTKASKKYDVSKFIERIYKAMSFYETQFTKSGVKSFCNYIRKYPFVDMIKK